ncbi:hypothetical protein RJ55_05520 [Drechmeria coniospora]|nr:hypothetical protein RJ55_05520 [Drechmeria coniospora]
MGGGAGVFDFGNTQKDAFTSTLQTKHGSGSCVFQWSLDVSDRFGPHRSFFKSMRSIHDADLPGMTDDGEEQVSLGPLLQQIQPVIQESDWNAAVNTFQNMEYRRETSRVWQTRQLEFLSSTQSSSANDECDTGVNQNRASHSANTLVMLSIGNNGEKKQRAKTPATSVRQIKVDGGEGLEELARTLSQRLDRLKRNALAAHQPAKVGELHVVGVEPPEQSNHATLSRVSAAAAQSMQAATRSQDQSAPNEGPKERNAPMHRKLHAMGFRPEPAAACTHASRTAPASARAGQRYVAEYARHSSLPWAGGRGVRVAPTANFDFSASPLRAQKKSAIPPVRWNSF